MSSDSANSKLSLTRVRERMGQSEEKTLPMVGRRRGGGGAGGVGEKKNPEQPNTLFISFLPINALKLPKETSKKVKINRQEQ